MLCKYETNHVYLKKLTLLALVFLMPHGISAQAPTEQPKGNPASRIRTDDSKAGEDRTVILESEITFSIKIPEIQFTPCEATISLAYYQRNTLARVESTIVNNACPVSSGTFELIASIRDEFGETATRSFPESWQLESMTEISFTRDYPIGENMELLRMRSGRSQCECTQPIEE